MLDGKRDRYTYYELLEPPEGYKFDKSIITTYNIDIRAMREIYIQFGLNEDMHGDDSDYSDQQYNNNLINRYLKALEYSQNRICVVCQKDKIKVSKPKIMDNEIMKSISKVSMEEKSFHPKVWIVKYKKLKENGVAYKILVGSKNLTLSNMLETQMCIEGYEKKDKCSEFSNDIINFLESLKNCIDSEENSFESIKEEMINDIKNGIDFKFRLEDDDNSYKVKDVRLITLGGKVNKEIDLFDCQKENAIVITPFFSIQKIIKLCSTSKKVFLITRMEEIKKNIDKLKGNNIFSNLEVYTTKDDLVKIDEDELRGDIHSKLYIFEQKNKTAMYIGSPNATMNAFEGNFEAVVKITIKRS